LGDVVRLTATPVAGWSFSGWSGALSGSANPADLTVTGNLTVTATFIQNTYTVSVTVLPSSAAGTVTPNVSSPYHYGDLVVLTESPNLGYTFSGWSGDGSGTGSTRSVTVTGNMAVTATFIQDQYALTMYTIGQGSVVPGNQTFASGTVVDINAINAVGWTFAGWSGGASGSVNTTVTMNGPVSVTATFTQNVYTLTVGTVGNGNVNLNNTGPYHYGDMVELTAVPLTGWSLQGWSGDLLGSANPATILINGNKAVTAIFTQDTYALTVSTVGSGSINLNNSGPYFYGDVVELTAIPAAGWSFDHWGGKLSGSINPTTILIDGDKAVTASFTQNVYTLIVTTAGSGSVNLNNSGPYHYGDAAQLTAVPAAGWIFQSWSGDLLGSANPATILINGNKAVMATFTQNAHSLTVSTVGSGSVVKFPDQAVYGWGTNVTLTATPITGWSFDHWSGDASGTVNPIIVNITSDKTVTATFTQNTYTLTVDTVGSGSVNLNNSGPYHYGDVVQLTATPAAGWSFSGWSGDFSSSSNPVSVIINGTTFVTATFVQNTYTLTVTTVGSSTVNLNNSGPYHYGDVVELTAAPAAGWSFDHWSGDLTGSINPTTILIDVNKTVTATFTQNTYTLTVTILGTGSVSLNNSGPYHYRDIVEVTANPAAGWSFDHWNGGLNGSVNPTTILIDSNKAVTATFTQNTYTLTVSTVGIGAVNLNNTGPYYYGDVVELTAVPAAGWIFQSWSGDMLGSTNPSTIVINGNMAVTAAFTDTYSLTVSVVGSGSVGKVPDQASYHLGDVVGLTAAPAAGWSFSGWSGDFSSSLNPVSIIINGTTSVTATFIQDQYALTMYTIGQGSVVPGNQTFASGTVVDINAINAVGWTFAGWSGGASGSVNTTVTMNGPVSVTASFTSSAPAVFGKTTVGASTNTLPVGYVVACRFQAPTDGTATMVSAYVRARYQSGFAKIVVYSDNAGQAGNLLFESNQTSLSTGWAWQNFSINYKLQAGKYYWFTIFTSVESQFVYDAGETNQQAVAWGWSYPSVPAAFNGMYGPSYANRVASIYVTYTPDI